MDKRSHFSKSAGYLLGENDTGSNDLIEILVFRRYWLAAIFFIAFTLVLIHVFFQKQAIYRYTSILEIGKLGQEKPIEPNAQVLEKLKNQNIPLAIRAYLLENNMEDLPFSVSAKEIKGSELVVVSSKALENDFSRVEALHALIIKGVLQEHESSYDLVSDTLEKKIEIIEGTVSSKGEGGINTGADQGYIEKLELLKENKKHMSRTNVKKYGVRSITSLGPSNNIIIGLGFLTSVTVAILSVLAFDHIGASYLNIKRGKGA